MAFRCKTCQNDIPPGNASCPRCGAPVSGTGPEKVIDRLEAVAPGAILADRYEMIRELGAGGMGVVWLAHDRVRDEPVALKLLPKAVAHDPVAMVGIRREANLSLKLTHPNILRLLNLELAPFPFLLMEFVEGRSLQTILAEKMETSADGIGRLTPLEVTKFLGGLADGLDHAHKIGVIHRDIKPANIMILGGLDNPLAKLTDFGIAAQLRDTATHLTQQGMAGTPVYMAPEQLKRKRIDKRVDVYALGVTIYQLLSGTLPFLTEFQIHNDPVPEIDGQTALMYEVMCKALARDPDQRYQSAGEFASDFQLVVDHGDAPIPGAEDNAHGHAHAAPAPPAYSPPPAYAPPPQAYAPPEPAPRPAAMPEMPPPQPSAGGAAESNVMRRLARMGGGGGGGAAAAVDDAAAAVAIARAVPPAEVPTPRPQPPPAPAPAPPPPPPPMPSAFMVPSVPAGFTPLEKGPNGVARYRCEKDGAVMVLVPAGSFTMGAADGGDDEKPPHPVQLGAYLMDATPVTNVQFERFVEATGYVTEAERDGKGWAFDGKRFTTAVKGATWRTPSGPDSSIAGKSDAPVVQISWNDAEAYAAWAGKKLPTEAQWERAAKGNNAAAKHPWGDEPPDGRAYFNQLGAGGPTKVGSHPPNSLGLSDMAGNVWEWCLDWYAPAYYKESPPADPIGPDKGGSKVVRGGCWHGNAQQLRCSYRHRSDPVQRNSSTGFRCIVPVPMVPKS